MTIAPSQIEPQESEGDAYSSEHAPAPVTSPFAENQLLAGAPEVAASDPRLGHLVSPFTEAAGLASEGDLEEEAIGDLLAELEDEEFTEALEVLVQDGAARHAVAMGQWAGESEAAAVAATEVEQWLEAVASSVEQRLSELEDQFGERTLDSLGEDELDALGGGLASEATSPLAMQEDFFKKIWKKVKKVAKGAVRLAKKGISTLSRFLPIGKLLGALRRLIRPLLRRVLGKAIGRLPAPLQPAARRLARRFGLEAESAEAPTEELTSPFSAGEELAEEFDRTLVGYLLAPEDSAAEAVAAAYGEQQAGDPVAGLDDARRRLTAYFAAAEQGADPTTQMEQFIPAVLPLVKIGVKIVGRKRVVGLVANLLAQLIRPMVGAQLAPVLSRHIASSGLSLIGLEAEAEEPQLGAEALTSLVEETVREVFAIDPEALEDELLTSGIVQEAFAEAATRHLPAAVLRPELHEEAEDERGVWVMMPRGRRGPPRYRAYSRRVPVVLHRPMARAIVIAEDETLEDRLLEAGVTGFPVQAEVDAYELLPGGQVGHVVASEMEAEVATASVGELAEELFELEDESPLRFALPPTVARRGRAAVPRRQHPARRYVRIRVGGVPLRRRSALTLRLDLSGPRPVLTVLLRVGERRAHELASRLGRRDRVAAVGGFQAWVRGPMAAVITARLRRVLARRHIVAPDAALTAASARITAALSAAFAAHAAGSAPQLAAAAKDPARGITLAFTLTFPSKAALLTTPPERPSLSVSPGWRRG
jgi:hypothetical protein